MNKHIPCIHLFFSLLSIYITWMTYDHLPICSIQQTNVNYVFVNKYWVEFLSCNHGLISFIDTKAKCRHLKKLTCKGTLRQVFIRVIDCYSQSCWYFLPPPPPSPYTQRQSTVKCVTGRGWEVLSPVETIFCRSLKGVWYEIFDLRFFSWSVSPGLMSIPLGPFRIISKICGDILEWLFITGQRHRR